MPFMYVHRIIPTSLEGHIIRWTWPRLDWFLMEPLFASSSGWLLCWGLWIWGCCGFGFSFVLLLLALAEVGPVLSSLLFWCCFEVFDGVSFIFPCHMCFLFVFYPSHCPSPAVLSLCSSGFAPGVCPSFPRPRSVLSPHPPPPRPLTDPPPPSLAGTLCRTVWRKSIRQSNPESRPSGPSRERWVWQVRDQATLLHRLFKAFSSTRLIWVWVVVTCTWMVTMK